MSRNSLSIWLAASLWIGTSGCETKKAAPSSAAPPAVENAPTSAQGGTPGACKPGFEAKGDKCVDIDECSFVASVCGTPQATCSNKPGGYECTCPRGYAGGGPLGIACTPRVVSGATASCALPESGGVVCWGAKDGGVWSDEYPDEVSATPASIAVTENAVSLALGSSHNCILRKDGTVGCWGDNQFGQLGTGKEGRRTVPQDVPGLEGVVQIAAGTNNTCAVLKDQSLRCWGANKSGELTADFPAKTTTPKPLAVGKIVRIYLGVSHACALLTNGKVTCWGENYYGELGTGTSEPPGHPRPPTELKGLEGVRALVHNAALLADGGVMVWGEDHTNRQMTLDEVTGIIQRAPMRVPELEDIVAIGGGMYRFCALNKQGKVSCRGVGPLGDGKDRNSTTPVEVAISGQVVAIATGGDCAIDARGALLCWGSNRFLRLGGKTLKIARPTAVAGVGVLTQAAL